VRLPRLRRLGLRARITLIFALGALLLSAVVTLTTYTITRTILVDEREQASRDQFFANATQVDQRLADEEVDLEDLLSSLPSPSGAQPILFQDGDAFTNSLELDESALPESLRAQVQEGVASSMRYRSDSEPQLALGVRFPDEQAEYYEVVNLSSLENTLSTLAAVLMVTSLLTTLAAAGLGWWASRGALRPLAEVSMAAEAIAGGRLDTRLSSLDDPDLAVLASSFNDMASALEDRIERDARFASDVSHELRSPLMTLSASIEVLEKRRDEMPERARAALDLLVEEIARFQQLVTDLLEISRVDAGQVRLEREPVDVAEMVIQVVSASPRPVPVRIAPDATDVVIDVDKRRLVRVLDNLLDNAQKHGGGATGVSLNKVDGYVIIAVDDNGPGVSEDDRKRIFHRFARGGIAAGRRGAADGVGLGLALVDEHVRLHGGEVHVEDRPDGEQGARFVVELPLNGR
jgi:signal transduction histidine kinase